MNAKYINIRGKLLDLNVPKVMGIINVTPDSFFSGSRVQSQEVIVRRCRQMLQEGADFIDIGAQSTAPTSLFLTAQEERTRLMPMLQLIRKEIPEAILSLDTFYADVAKEAVEKFGVDIINDISGGEIDKTMFETVARLNVPYILMHMRGTPQTMQQHTSYDDLLQDIIFYFSKKINQLNRLGVKDIILDPGFGFSKTMIQNYELMAYLKYFSIFDVPLLVGISRKSMIYKLLDSSPEECLNGTSVLNTYALLSGANILRVHDVKEAVECVKIVSQITAFDK